MAAWFNTGVTFEMLLFHPWIGPNYQVLGFSGHRILILGESHYGMPEDESPSFTVECIEGMAKAKHGHSFFTKTAKIFLERESGVPLTQSERSNFWDRVAFFNYIQCFPSKTARTRPTPAMWKFASTVFPLVIQELQPTFVLVLGNALKQNLPEIKTKATFFYVPHPSSFGFRPQEWRPQVLSALASAGAET
ncbi:hypothetical protein [Xanthomonas arboricola]|uniref:hypothetical protein n=1 Tax=Xanthomonas arboricola TaxID=56448 RepID=UPI0018C8B0A8|nr:hypothetical protein [Xanthomonas arboricola]